MAKSAADAIFEVTENTTGPITPAVIAEMVERVHELYPHIGRAALRA